MKKDVSVSIPVTDAQKHQQRPSLISMLTGQAPHISGQQSSIVVQDSKNGTGGHTPSDSLSQNTLNPPRESFSSSSTTTNKEPGVSSENHSSVTTPSVSVMTSVIPASSSIIGGSTPLLPHSSSMQPNISKPHPQRLRFVQSVEFRHSSGERSTTPLSPESPTEESSGETQKPHRLQRSKAQSRKTFRLKRSQNSNRDLLETVILPKETSAVLSPPTLTHTSTSSLTPVVQTSSLTTTPATSSNFTTTLIRPISDVSWDSVSQTSSTSGYRDNYSFQTGFLSPDDKSGSQQSLLMLFEAQDEDTLI